MKRTTVGTLAAVVMPALLAACTTEPERAADPRGPFFFDCDDGRTLTVRFDPAAHTVWVLQPGKDSRVLPRTRSGSNYWYTDGTFAFRGQGDEARWQAPGAPAVNCRRRAG